MSFMLVYKSFLTLIKRSYIKDIIGVTILNIGNFLVPFFINPYVARKVGLENFGIINFSISFSSFFYLLVNYGFELYTTRIIALSQGNRKVVEEAISKTFSAKLYLFLLSVLLFGVSLFFSGKVREFAFSNLLAYTATIGVLFSPVWFYQGIGKIVKFSLINFVLKVAAGVITVFMVTKYADFNTYLVINSVTQILIGSLAFLFIFYGYNYSLKIYDLRSSFTFLKEPFEIFLTTAVINVYIASNTFLVGMIGKLEDVSLFSSSAKIILAVTTIVGMGITQVLYPKMAKSIHQNVAKGIETLFKIAKFIIPVNLLIAVFLFVFSKQIIVILFGEAFAEAANVLKLLSIIPFLNGLNNLFCIQGLLNLGMKKKFLIIVTCSSLLGFFINFFCIPQYRYLAPCFAWLFSELFITVSSFSIIYSYKKKLQYGTE